MTTPAKQTVSINYERSFMNISHPLSVLLSVVTLAILLISPAHGAEDFLQQNMKKEGVVSLPSGLQYKVLQAGEGKKPKATDSVTVHYRGTLTDGTEFDSSIKRGKPATFPLNRVIAGWTEGLQLMKEGAKYELYIPSALGYGSRGAGRLIKPNSTLIFEVELIKIN